ncbi:ABC transporter permease [Pandoraea thiooxydans]|uniref:ABC transporter permease n=1 Tax=Pandoraea thiooxydans TaxID=445709 RepID=A0A0G3ER81_9BURK|nr:ABC transporter permease [Pandoraea thiooxydans]AKJ69450.1 ABC transporter permease [Pandoraea thiooxydans]APR97113.1 ABC transporter permease [Pandoraea thiooxydans]
MNAQFVTRPEIMRDTVRGEISEIQRPLSAFESVYRISWLRKLALLLGCVLTWEIYARWLSNPLLFPTFSDTLSSFFFGIASGALLSSAAISLRTLIAGYCIGIVLAMLLTSIAFSTKLGADFLETLASMFNPLPAIALLPLALLWFGLGESSLIFVTVHSVLWSVALNMHSGFRAVSPVMRMVGRNYGLKGFVLVRRILIPAAFPSILAGLKIGWAFAWRTMIAAELVFGTSSGRGGLGWYIFKNRNQLETANVFSGLFFVIVIGLLVENVVFAGIEKRTIRRWGTQI